MADASVLPHGMQNPPRRAWWRRDGVGKPVEVMVTDVRMSEGQLVVRVLYNERGWDAKADQVLLVGARTEAEDLRKEIAQLEQRAKQLEDIYHEALVEKALESRWCPKCNADGGDACDWGGQWTTREQVHPQRMRGVTVDI